MRNYLGLRKVADCYEEIELTPLPKADNITTEDNAFVSSGNIDVEVTDELGTGLATDTIVIKVEDHGRY